MSLSETPHPDSWKLEDAGSVMASCLLALTLCYPLKDNFILLHVDFTLSSCFVVIVCLVRFESLAVYAFIQHSALMASLAKTLVLAFIPSKCTTDEGGGIIRFSGHVFFVCIQNERRERCYLSRS